MTSGGEEEKIETAKKYIKNGIIGIVIILMSWAIATFIISRLGGAISGTGCLDGETQSCGCGGSMVCSGGSWSGCVGSDCGGGVGPTYCDASPNPGCQAEEQICAATDYCDSDDCRCKPKGNLGDPCDADLNNASCEPNNNRCAQYLSCNPETCLCFGPPVITELSPVGGFCAENANQACTKDTDCATTCNLDTPNGAPDNFITIFGKNFGAYSATTSKVVFLGDNAPQEGKQPTELNPACIDSWRDDQIIIAVPNVVNSGALKVVNQDNLEDTTNDTYGPSLPDFKANTISRPGLCKLNPNRGILSSEVTYQGIKLYSSDAYFGNYQTNVRGLDSVFDNPVGLSGTSTTPNIRSGESGSFVINNQKSNYLKFIKDPEEGEGPYIISFTPIAGSAGQYVTINGRGFGGARGASKVYFGNTEASYDFPEICLNSVWKDKQIIVKVPADLPDGYHLIKINLGTSTIDTEKLNPNTFQADKNLSLKTSLCKIEPTRGPIATPVSIWGEYFGAENSEALIKFNYDKTATGTVQKDGRADTIKTSVPLDSITGPVRVIKNSEYGNELNFEIGECLVDSDCDNTEVCCPASTYKKGRCSNSLAECFIDVPTSVFEWSFNTDFGNSTNTSYYSCAGLAKALGSCQVGQGCPNVPGTCSPYSGGTETVLGPCDYSCVDVALKDSSNGYTYSYEASLDKCVRQNYTCDPAGILNYSYSGQNYQLPQTCNQNGRWEISFSGSCPEGWTRKLNNICEGPSCKKCGATTSCQTVNGADRCVSEKLCSSEANCKNTGNCVITAKPDCDCCCEKGQDARDCCAPLKCANTCGSGAANLGRCSGCALVGTTTAEHDAACNCTGHSGQYCDDTTIPEGICVDCTGLAGKQNCNDHSGVCCFDADQTSTTTDDFCRGGEVVSQNPADLNNYGYCAYYDCQSSTPPDDPSLCASSTPLKFAYYETITKCVSGCAANEGQDFCSLFNGQESSCLAENRCCFDETTKDCRSGTRINDGLKDGFCAYYNCQSATSTPPGNPKLCNLEATTTGAFASTSTCAIRCANNEGGAGLSCASQTSTSSCDTNLCTLPNFSCLTATGTLGFFPDCGACCCKPGQAIDTCISSSTPNLHCQADRGNCSGAGRGLCCGCSKDSDCGFPNTTGCGLDTCCEARPKISSTLPADSALDVCRNTVIKINFNQLMDITSFNTNVLLLEERNYGNGVCPAGTFITKINPVLDSSINKNLLSVLYNRIKTFFTNFSAYFAGQAVADTPDPHKLYCAIPGSVLGEVNGNTTSLVFAPQKLLEPATNYYVVVKGDENLNSQTGILSLKGIGFNGEGYYEFNKHGYLNSQIIKFTTLSDQGSKAGICAINHVGINPESYLFKTTNNDLDENDADPLHKTFDTKVDKDKVFSAWAHSLDDQVLQPVTGYFWDWNFVIDNPNIAAINSVAGLDRYKAFVSAQEGVTDSETKITASINMDRFTGANCDSSPNCACQGANCVNNCCNAYSTGDGFNKIGNIYVFLCNNPWPPVDLNGNWSPWNDNCQGALGGLCANFNYKFYYCRDAGNETTLDDLPAIINPAVIRGQGASLVCSSDKTPCLPPANTNTKCGLDQNGDGQADGLCIWNVLKESYFFREAIPTSGQIIDALDQQTGQTVKVNWQAPASQVFSYKIYYLKAGKGNMMVKEVTPAQACTTVGNLHNCSTDINNLTTGISYVFKVSVISVNKTESQLSNEKTATPTDKTPPGIPVGLQAELIASSTVRFTWDMAQTDPVNSGAFYRLYHGINSGQYGESFDAAVGASSLTLNQSQFPKGNNYFSSSAIDAYNNESGRSSEILVVIPQPQLFKTNPPI